MPAPQNERCPPDATMEGGRLNLTEIHSRNTIEKLMFFKKATDCTNFLKDYAFNENKSILQNAKGLQTQWSCASGSDVCPWFVLVSQKRPPEKVDKVKDTELAGIPTKAWFVSKFNLVHSDICTSVGKCSTRQLSMIPGLKGALVKGYDSSAVRLVESLKDACGMDMSTRSPTLYRAIAAAKRDLENKDRTDIKYLQLTRFLLKLNQTNPMTRVCSQLDSEGQFSRIFVSIGDVVAGQDCWLPVRECDGTHLRGSTYNGACLTLLGKDGNGANVLAAFAFVHQETTDNFAWFFANCIVAGIRLYDCPIFSDRDKQLEAQKLLWRLGFHVHLRFCSLHIEFNAIDIFKSVEPSIVEGIPLIYKLQACSTLLGFDQVLDEIREAYPNPLHPGTDREETLADYLGSINPTSWTRFGNYVHTDTEASTIRDRWPNVCSFGDPLPRFGTQTTSGNEGENNALQWNSTRSEEASTAVLRCCERCIKVCSTNCKKAESYASSQFNLTPRAKAAINSELQLISRLTVL